MQQEEAAKQHTASAWSPSRPPMRVVRTATSRATLSLVELLSLPLSSLLAAADRRRRRRRRNSGHWWNECRMRVKFRMVFKNLSLANIYWNLVGDRDPALLIGKVNPAYTLSWGHGWERWDWEATNAHLPIPWHAGKGILKTESHAMS